MKTGQQLLQFLSGDSFGSVLLMVAVEQLVDRFSTVKLFEQKENVRRKTENTFDRVVL